MKTLFSVFLTFLFFISASSANAQNNPYEGMYKGTFSLAENYEYYGLNGIFVGHVDSKGQATMWLGNNEDAYKTNFQVNSNGYAQFTVDGAKVSLTFNNNGSISASINSGQDLSFASTRIKIDNRAGTNLLANKLKDKATNKITIKFPSDYNQSNNTSEEELKDQLLLMAGSWKINNAKIIIDGSYAVNMSGDMIILPDSIYTYGQANGQKVLVSQNPFTFDYSSFKLNSATLDWQKKQITAKGSGYFDGYYGTINYTITQTKSYYNPRAVTSPKITGNLSAINLKLNSLMKRYTVTTNFGAKSFTAKSLPDGLKLDASTGVISGKPTKKGIFNTTITAAVKQGGKITRSATAKLVFKVN